MPRFCAALALLSLFLLPQTLPAQQIPFDHSLWDQFLKTYVNEAGEVDYARVQREPETLRQYLAAAESVIAEDFSAWPREERLALLVNLFNAAVIEIATKHYPIKTLNEIPGVWDLPAVKLGGKNLSLNQLRQVHLVGQFRDEKIQTVLSSGAKSAPMLRREAFTGPRVEGQLYLAARDFVNDPLRNPIQPGKKHLTISRIFKWYAGDFKLDFGFRDEDDKYSVEENSVLAFLAYYLDDRAKIEYLEERRYKIKYAVFDWTLNDWKSSPGAPS